MVDTFLTKEEIAILTGRKLKTKQIQQLRKMGLPFWINAAEAPVVPRSAIDGPRHAPAAPAPPRWTMPRVKKL